MSSRSFGRRSICRNRSYDFFCTSIRFGIGIEVLILEKSTRSGAAPLCCKSILILLTAEQPKQRKRAYQHNANDAAGGEPSGSAVSRSKRGRFFIGSGIVCAMKTVSAGFGTQTSWFFD